MKTALVIISFLVVTFIVLFFILGVTSRSGEAAGLVKGKLSKCPGKPNCVCSEQGSNAGHYVKPIVIPQNTDFDILFSLKNTIQDMGGTVQVESDNYLASSFSSAIFGFVDDFEVRIDSIRNTIHIRSASRVGHSDMGVNRKRVELFRQLYRKNLSEASRR